MYIVRIAEGKLFLAPAQKLSRILHARIGQRGNYLLRKPETRMSCPPTEWVWNDLVPKWVN